MYASNAVNGVGVREVMNELKNQVRAHMYAHLRHTRVCVLYTLGVEKLTNDIFVQCDLRDTKATKKVCVEKYGPRLIFQVVHNLVLRLEYTISWR